MNPILIGALAMAYFVVGLFFLRFWQVTRDRLFGLFALAFVVLAVNRVGIGLVREAGEGDRGDYFYWVRLLAFVLILVAIIDKNRSPKPPPS